jgi:type III secretion protein J
MIQKIPAWLILPLFLVLLLLTGCQQNTLIVSGVEEREANEIIVFLASRGIPATKAPASSSAPGASQGAPKWSISVNPKQSTDAMAILNQNGLPRIKGPNLLDLFAKQGMMSSEKEDTIRYQAGLSEQIAGTIRKIDGVIDADVQISFPTTDASSSALPWEQTTQQKITAAVYVKHQGILDDPNSHLTMKIKRLVAGSVNGLDVNDVTVISDRSRFTDISLGQAPEMLSAPIQEKDYVSIWSIVMSKSSASRFRVLFFFLSLFAVIFAVFAAWLIWKLYPTLKTKDGLKQLLKTAPFPVEAPQPAPAPPPIDQPQEAQAPDPSQSASPQQQPPPAPGKP